MPEIEEQDLRDRIKDFIYKHPMFIASAGFVYLSYVGLMTDWIHFRRIGINLFHYVEPDDFLLSVFKKPILAAIVLFIVFGSYWLFHSWLYRKIYKSTTNIPKIFIAIFWGFLVFMPLYAGFILEVFLYKSSNELYNIHFQKRDMPHKTNLLLYGSTGSFYFFHDRNNKLIVVPKNNLARMDRINSKR